MTVPPLSFALHKLVRTYVRIQPLRFSQSPICLRCAGTATAKSKPSDDFDDPWHPLALFVFIWLLLWSAGISHPTAGDWCRGLRTHGQVTNSQKNRCGRRHGACWSDLRICGVSPIQRGYHFLCNHDAEHGCQGDRTLNSFRSKDCIVSLPVNRLSGTIGRKIVSQRASVLSTYCRPMLFARFSQRRGLRPPTLRNDRRLRLKPVSFDRTGAATKKA